MREPRRIVKKRPPEPPEPTAHQIMCDWHAKEEERKALRKRLREKGLLQVKTRGGSYAYAMQNPEKMASPVIVEKEDVLGPATFVPVHHPGKLINLSPRLKRTDFNEWAVFVIRTHPRPTDKPMLYRGGFGSACRNGKSCGKTSCAACWAAKIDPPRGFKFVVREVYMPDKMKVKDPNDADPRGHRGKGGVNWSAEEKWDVYNR